MPETPEHIEPQRQADKKDLTQKRRLQMQEADFTLDERLARTSGIRESVQNRAKQVKLTKFELLLKFLKPITWIPVMWSFVCGAVASGVFGWSNLLDAKFWLGILLTGPLATGVCQMLNDYFDRDLDAINEPSRPIPAGDISLRDATILISVWTLITVVVAALLHPFVLAHVILGIINAHLYSANPIKLKKRLWWGQYHRGVLVSGLSLAFRRSGLSW